MQPYAHLAAVAEKAGVVIKSYGPQPNWSWDRAGAAGGCGLPSKEDALMDAVLSLGLMDRGDGYADWACDSCDERAALPKNYYADICKQCSGRYMRLQRPQDDTVWNEAIEMCAKYASESWADRVDKLDIAGTLRMFKRPVFAGKL
jgi:hypothetical protein